MGSAEGTVMVKGLNGSVQPPSENQRRWELNHCGIEFKTHRFRKIVDVVFKRNEATDTTFHFLAVDRSNLAHTSVCQEAPGCSLV